MNQTREEWLRQRIKLYERSKKKVKFTRPYDNALTFFRAELRRELVKVVRNYLNDNSKVLSTIRESRKVEHQEELSSSKEGHKLHKLH